MQYMEITFLCSSSVIPAVLTQQFGVHPISWWFQTFLSPLVIGRYNQTNAILWYFFPFVPLPPSLHPQKLFFPRPPPPFSLQMLSVVCVVGIYIFVFTRLDTGLPYSTYLTKLVTRHQKCMSHKSFKCRDQYFHDQVIREPVPRYKKPKVTTYLVSGFLIAPFSLK